MSSNQSNSQKRLGASPVSLPPKQYRKQDLGALVVSPKRPKQIVALLSEFPSALKFVLRAEREGLTGNALVASVIQRFTDASRVESNRPNFTIERGSSSMVPYSGNFARQQQQQSPQHGMLGEGYMSSGRTNNGFVNRNAMPSLGLPGRMPQTNAYLNNAMYPEYYVRNFSRAYPMPLASVDSLANKTLPVTATVTDAITIPAGKRAVIFPTPEHPHNVPYMVMIEGDSGSWLTKAGSWFGTLSPQALCGTPPIEGNVDDRSVQFKGGVLEISAAVAYNATASLGYLDPYTTLHYGKAVGFVQQRPPVDAPMPSDAFSSEYREWPYLTAETAINFSDLMNIAVRASLVGSSKQSSMNFRQIIKPISNNFCPMANPSVVNRIDQFGWPLMTPIDGGVHYPGNGMIFGQGMYLIDNINSATAVAIEIAMDMHFRVRIDNKAPAVYMMADDRTTPKHTIEFMPSTATAGTRAASVDISHKANGTPGSKPPAPVSPSTAAIKADSLPSSILSGIPLVGGDLNRAAGGLERAFTKGDDIGELVGGLGDFALGGLGAMGSLMKLFS